MDDEFQKSFFCEKMKLENSGNQNRERGDVDPMASLPDAHPRATMAPLGQVARHVGTWGWRTRYTILPDDKAMDPTHSRLMAVSLLRQ